MRYIYYCLLGYFLLSEVRPVNAQQKNSVYVELFGSSSPIGLRYDLRLGESRKWGISTGVSYVFANSYIFKDTYPNHVEGVSFPISVNYLVGRKYNHFEIGAGFSVGFNMKCEYDFLRNRKNETRSGHLIFTDIGYRYVSSKGFVLRLGVTPSCSASSIWGDNFNNPFYLYIKPYLGVGYSF